MKIRSNKWYGWKRDQPDFRDYLYIPKTKKLPTSIDLRTGFPSVPYDQGALGSCTANSISGAIQFDQKKQNLPVVMPSRLFIYYNERVIEGTPKEDSGATIRDSVKTINDSGYAAEKTWAYNIKKFATKPPAKAYAEGKKDKTLVYKRVTQGLSTLKGCLADGYPICIGFTVYESFESGEVAQTGIVPMPSSDESVLGGHAVACCGYDNSKKWFICRNSWGTDWGNSGYFFMPYAYLTNPNLASDFWQVSHVN